eukprot:1828481-Prorocentrum_lima.AAC.1
MWRACHSRTRTVAPDNDDTQRWRVIGQDNNSNGSHAQMNRFATFIEKDNIGPIAWKFHRKNRTAKLWHVTN